MNLKYGIENENVDDKVIWVRDK